MATIQRLLMAGLVLVSAGWLIGCSPIEPDQGSLPPLPPSNDLQLQTISTILSSPVFMTAPSGDSTRLFVVEQGGRIRIFDLTAGSLLTTSFLDISSLLSTGGERGLLGMAFDPQYATNRRFYVYYTNNGGDIVIARYLRNANAANSLDLILLGLGEDGHTASLFPGAPVLRDRQHLIAATQSPKDPPNRLTMTLAAINRASVILFLVAGAGKTGVVRAILDPKTEVERQLPASLVEPEEGRIVWFLDRAAAAELPIE
ncbi:MAG: hypothetical protein E8D50_12240 [Nitrospira sp.]|nr:MAG: hypothetical protein E8D50_12240 [Nitrospira sp.]